MKIHIVQKGDTLWDIAQKYKVDFEQLKSLNVQISSPDMIMPGMKIKIPMGQKPVTHQETKPKDPKHKEISKQNNQGNKPLKHSLKPHELPTLGDEHTKSPTTQKGTYLSSPKKIPEQTKMKHSKKTNKKYYKNKLPIKHKQQYVAPFTQQTVQHPMPYPMPPPPMPCCQQQPYYWPMQQMPQYVYGNNHPFQYPHTYQHYYGQKIGQPKRQY